MDIDNDNENTRTNETNDNDIHMDEKMFGVKNIEIFQIHELLR